MFEKNEYDRNVNTFSNQGRLFQVEYAMKAVEQGCTTLGIQLNFNEEMPVEAISLAVCDVALSFAEKKKKQKQKNEKRVVSRPYGVAMLIGGIDSDGEPKLFKNDPSGNYVRYKACCIGQGGENGMSTLQSN